MKKNFLKGVEDNGEQICIDCRFIQQQIKFNYYYLIFNYLYNLQIVDVFNNYFTTIAHQLNNNIPALPY